MFNSNNQNHFIYLALYTENFDEEDSFKWLKERIYYLGNLISNGSHREKYVNHIVAVNEDFLSFSIVEPYPETDDNGNSTEKMVDKIQIGYLRDFKRGYTHGIQLAVCKETYDKFFEFFDNCIRTRATFDTWYQWRFIPVINLFFQTVPENKYFCSQLIIRALQYAGILDRKLEAHKFTPQGVVDLILDKQDPKGIVTTKCDWILDKTKNKSTTEEYLKNIDFIAQKYAKLEMEGENLQSKTKEEKKHLINKYKDVEVDDDDDDGVY